MHTRNFDTYKFTRFSWVPEIDVHLIDAIFDAKGARVYRMPMTQERVLEAMKLV